MNKQEWLKKLRELGVKKEDRSSPLNTEELVLTQAKKSPLNFIPARVQR